MTTEQLGIGGSDVTKLVKGPLFSNGVTTAPTITTLPVTATTADIAALGTAVNSVLNALSNLGLIVKA
jgi:hypothetical protein